MKRFSIGVGIGFDRFHRPIATEWVINTRAFILREAAKQFGGVTIRDTFGSWHDAHADIVHIEPGWTIEIFGVDSQESYTKRFALDIKQKLNQASIVFIVEDVQAEFIGD